MPVVLRHGPFRFFFFSNEGLPRERPHIHVRRGRALAKVGLESTVEILSSFGFKANELRTVLQVARRHRIALRRSWDAFFS